MTDFYVVNINPQSNKVLDKFKFNQKTVSVYPEDTFIDLRNKIWVAYGIPPYRQFIYTNDGHTLFDIFVNDIIIPININEWFSQTSKKHNNNDIVVSGIPINKFLTENKESIKVDGSNQYKVIGKYKQVYMVDLETLLTRSVVEESNILNESYRFDIMYYGFIIMFWPQLTHQNFKLYLKDPSDVLDVTLEEIKSIMKKEQKIVQSIHTSKAKLGTSITILNQLIQVDIGIRDINIRNVIDWFPTSSSIPAIVGYINDDLEGNTIVKKHASSDEQVNKVINRRSLLKVTKNTKPNVSFIIRKSDQMVNFVVFTIKENGFDSEIYTDYNEDEHVNLSKNLDSIIAYTKPIISKINNELDVAALPNGGKITYITKDSVVSQRLNMCTYWKKVVSLRSFAQLKQGLSEYENAGILELKQEECSHNDYQSDNCFLLTFKKGMLSEEGRDVKIQLRTTDIRIEVIKAKDVSEFHIIQKYLILFFESQKLSKDSPTDLAKYTLKTLHEKDPVLYDIKRYDKTKKVYSVLCQSTRQPILYTEEEFNSLPASKKASLVKYWNFTYQQPAYYECPNKKFPHLSFKVGKHPKNFCLPCCKKSEPSMSETDKQCLSDHVIDNVTVDSNYVLTYGKPVSVGRISRISRSLLTKIKSMSGSSCRDCDYVLYGVEQNVPSLSDCGIIMSIFASLAVNTSVEQFIKDFASKVVDYGSSYHLLGNGAAQVFDSPEHLADTIISVFVNKINDLIPLEDPEEWTHIITSIAKDIYNVEIVSWDERDESHPKLVISTDFSLESETKLLIINTNKTGSYPLFVTDGNDSNGPAVYTSMLDPNSADLEPVQILYTLINNLSSNIIHDQGLSQLCLLDTMFSKSDKWDPVVKLVDSRNLCYGIIAKNSSGDHVYVPIYYSTNGKYLKQVEASYNPKPKESYRKSTLIDFISDLNTLATDSSTKTCNSKTIEPTMLLTNSDGKYIGFQYGKLFYFHDPDSTPFPSSHTGNKVKKMLYDPFDIDRAIFNHTIDLTPEDRHEDIVRSEYRNRLYKLFLAEFTYFIHKERNKTLRMKLNKMISQTDFDSATSLQKLFNSLDHIDVNGKVISYDDRSMIKKVISDVREPVKAKIALDNTIFEFDQTMLSELQNLPIDKTESQVRKIMSGLVVLVDESTIDESSKLSNIYLPCQVDKTQMNNHCKSKKLKMINSLFDDYVKILSADIHNISVLDVNNVFDTSQFINHPGEKITIYRK
jgi:hypothetical protein